MEELWTSLEFWATFAHWLTGIGTVVLAIALFKTFKHLEVVTNMSKIETEYRLRPWIGPINGIKKMDSSINGGVQFSITIKNFGDLPASGVKAKSVISTKSLSRESLKEQTSEFNLGPLLPHMEKNYWFFVDHSMWDDVSKGDATMFVAIYFEYPSMSGSNGYGMISEYNKNSQIFVNKEMWIDYPEISLK
jgi:hypothetical protein